MEESGATAECAARPGVGSLALHATWEKLGESRESDGLRRKGGGKRGIPSSDTDEGYERHLELTTYLLRKETETPKQADWDISGDGRGRTVVWAWKKDGEAEEGSWGGCGSI
jgi:hypothetical protein